MIPILFVRDATENKLRVNQEWVSWLAQSVEGVTFDLRNVGLSLMLDVEIAYKDFKNLKNKYENKYEESTYQSNRQG